MNRLKTSRRILETTTGRRQLRRMVSEVRRGILGTHSSDGMCFAVCVPLQGYLHCLGYEAELVEADFGKRNHVWLELSDGTIIDPTADQFSTPLARLPRVYIGPLPTMYEQWMGQRA